jgi:hypothetical protein
MTATAPEKAKCVAIRAKEDLFMPFSKQRRIEEERTNPKNWITRECVVCGTAIKLNTVFEGRLADPNEPFTCDSCADAQ